MKTLLKLEHIALFIFSLILFYQTSYSWWLYPLLFLIPDLGMIGYIFNTKVGAFAYNVIHHYGLAVITLSVGIFFGIEIFALAGSILLGHAALDRVLGYGLKYFDSFKHTHINNL